MRRLFKGTSGPNRLKTSYRRYQNCQIPVKTMSGLFRDVSVSCVAYVGVRGRSTRARPPHRVDAVNRLNLIQKKWKLLAQPGSCCPVASAPPPEPAIRAEELLPYYGTNLQPTPCTVTK